MTHCKGKTDLVHALHSRTVCLGWSWLLLLTQFCMIENHQNRKSQKQFIKFL